MYKILLVANKATSSGPVFKFLPDDTDATKDYATDDLAALSEKIEALLATTPRDSIRVVQELDVDLQVVVSDG